MAKRWAWSFSKLNNFETCAFRHQQVDLLKNFKDGDGEALVWGNQVHEALANALKGIAPLPESMADYQRWVDKVLAGPGQLLVEQKYALTDKFGPTQYFAPNVWYRGIADVVRIHGDIGLALDWKGLPLSTPLPTPNGWTTMGDVAVGDLVFGRDGFPYPVTGKSTIKRIACSRIETTSGFGITCDAEHRWVLFDGRIVSTEALRPGDRIPLCEPVARRRAELPIDPYVFGFWLADGKHTSGEATKPDAWIWTEIERRGYSLGREYDAATRTQTILGIRGHLTALGVFGAKHIPRLYMDGDTQQRHELLAGIVDGDGTVNRLRRQVVVDMRNPHLIAQIAEIARSLGERVLTTSFYKWGFGKRVQVWRAAWRPRHNPFLIPRKREAAAAFVGGGRAYTEVRSVMACDPVPTQCVEVASPDHTYLCGHEYLVTHNTGRVKENSVQLALMAQCLFAHYPALQHVRSEFIWLQEDCTTPEIFSRQDMVNLWIALLPRVEKMETAAITKHYPAMPGGLCKSYCPVRSCQFHGKGTR